MEVADEEVGCFGCLQMCFERVVEVADEVVGWRESGGKRKRNAW